MNDNNQQSDQYQKVSATQEPVGISSGNVADLGKNITLNIYIKTQQDEKRPEIKELEPRPKIS